MDLKTYQAFTMAEALAAVKRDLGPDAVILQTRSFKRGGLLGLGAKTIIEVTAGVGPQKAAEKEATPKSAARPQQRRREAGRAYHRAVAAANVESVVPDAERTKRLAQAMAEQHTRSAPMTPIPPEAPRAAEKPPVKGTVVAAAPAAPAPAARRFVLTQPVASTPSSNVHEQVVAPTLRAERSTTEAAAQAVVPALMRDELSAIRSAVSRVLDGEEAEAPRLSGRLFDFYLGLIGQDLADELAQHVVEQAHRSLSPDERERESAVRAAVARELCRIIPTCEGDLRVETHDGRPMTIAFIGPTGVGKTTTLAKLAASYRLRCNANVGLITADTYRIAAIEQLRTYADILGLPLHVVTSPAEMEAACAAMRDKQVILIDTAGRSQNDRDRLADLKRLVRAARPHETHLVLSSTAGEKTLLREAEAFSQVGIDRLALTKLDEAVGFGTLVSVIRRVGKKLSYVTTGQEVPDHIEPAAPERLVELLLGGEVRR